MFRAELDRIRPPAGAVPDRVDRRLLRSAIARVTWESDILRVRSVPRYWTDQALGPVFDALLRPGVDEARIAEVIRLLRAVPGTLAHAPAALAGAAREFAAPGAGGTRRRGRPAGRVRRRTRRAVPRRPRGRPVVRRPRRGQRTRRLRPLGWRRRCPACRPPSRSARSTTSGSCARSPASRSPSARSRPSAAASTTGRYGSSSSTATAAAHVPEPPLPASAAEQCPRGGRRRSAGARVLRARGPAQPAWPPRPLPGAADARLPGAAALPRRRRRADRPGAADRERRRLRARSPAPACPTSTPPTPATRGPGSSTRASTTSSSRCPGGTPARCAGTTTTRAPTRASPSTTRS